MQEPIVRALAAAAFHGRGVAQVEVVQTHISWVFLAGDDVYKVKKAVRFRFLDFSTLARRRHFCAEEVRLNRRLAADIYLGVVGIRPADSGFAFCAADDPAACEVAVHMRRLPRQWLLPELLARGAVTTATVDAIVDRVAAFHRDAAAVAAGDAAGEPERVLAQMADDFAEMERFRGVTIDAADDDRIRAFCRDGVRDRSGLLRARCAAGRVRDGHGDLHAEHICLRPPAEGGIAIFDCIEFDPAFRRRDVAAEIAFLAMDLEFRGHPDLAAHLVARYAAVTDDAALPALVPLFACHRAYIRGKVDSLKSDGAEVAAAEREAARRDAGRHFALALRYVRRSRPCLVVVHGPSGTGKSTLARALAERTGFAHHASDAIRKELAGIAPTERVGREREEWLYAAAMSARTYDAMYARGAADLAAGRGTILDATFLRRVDRDRARTVARAAGLPIVLVECRAPEGEVVRRLRARAAADTDVSDADERVYRGQLGAYEPPAADEADRLQVDTSAGVDVALQRIEAELDRRLRS